MILNHLDLFSGIGGFSLASNWAGFNTFGFSEMDAHCSRILRHHWPSVPNYGDVRSIDILDRKAVLITGGFPCQPFSSAGKKKGREDDRHLWPEFYRIIRINKPHWIIAENVNGIVDMELDNILDDLETAGYETQSFIIPACAVKAPHRRERLWIVAHSMCERRHNGFNRAQALEINLDWERDLAAAQTEWAKLFPHSWKTFNFKNWMRSIANTFGESCELQNTKTLSERSKWSSGRGKIGIDVPALDWEEDQPPIPGMDDGIPSGVDRNRSLGNSIVPQVAYPILRSIALIERALHEQPY